MIDRILIAALLLALALGCSRKDETAEAPADTLQTVSTDSISVLSVLWDRHPGHVPVAQRLAQLCEQEGRLEESLAWWIRARHSDAPDNRPAYWLDFARLQHSIGHDIAAAASLDSLLAVRPEWPEALYNRGALCVNTGDAAGARTHWTRLLELAPEHAMAARVTEWLQNEGKQP